MRFCFYPILLTLSAAGMLTGTQPDRTTIGTTSLPGGTPAGNAYRAKLTAIGGTPPYSWSFLSGQLPTGLKLSDTGTLSGIPASAGQFSFNTGVEDTFRSMETAGSNLGNGTESDVVWAADMETGDTSQWYAPSNRAYGYYGGGEYDSGVASSTASQDYAHTGSWSLKMTITTPSSPSSGTRMFRWLESQTYPALYYSAWYYFPQVYSVPEYWNVFQWKSSRSSGQNDPFYILNVGNRDDGSMYFYLYDWQRGISYSQSVMNIPVGQWFHVSAFYRSAGDGTGQVAFWQDGVQLFDLSGVQTRYADGDCGWSVNNYSNGLQPTTSSIYIDDASITVAR